MAAPVNFPPLRPRSAGSVAVGAVEKYERFQAFEEFTLGDTLATVATFAGKPDSIVLSARLFPALVVLTDRLDRELDRVAVPVGTSIETHISAERVRAQNQIAGSNAALFVHGKWAEPAESTRGYR